MTGEGGNIRDDITEETKFTEPEGTSRNRIAATDEHQNDWDRITQILEDDNADDK